MWWSNDPSCLQCDDPIIQVASNVMIQWSKLPPLWWSNVLHPMCCIQFVASNVLPSMCCLQCDELQTMPKPIEFEIEGSSSHQTILPNEEKQQRKTFKLNMRSGLAEETQSCVCMCMWCVMCDVWCVYVHVHVHVRCMCYICKVAPPALHLLLQGLAVATLLSIHSLHKYPAQNRRCLILPSSPLFGSSTTSKIPHYLLLSSLWFQHKI